MEAQVRPASLTASPSSVWIVGPVFDLALFANLGWLLAWLPVYLSTEGTPHIEFWQIYFLTTPHRWITLVLVATDAQRRAGRTTLCIALAVIAFLALAGVWLVTGTLLCLLLIDYLWNGWHFASQHAGVLRIYSRKAGGGRAWLERDVVRLFIVYVIARTAGWATGWLEEWPDGLAMLWQFDLLMLCLPAGILLAECRPGSWQRRAKLIYLASVLGLYSSLLLALRAHDVPLTLALTAASAAFHAIEYLALVSHYAKRRANEPDDAAFLVLARDWPLFLAGFILLFGFAAWTMEGLQFWLALNLWAAFLHYAYDGMIWKLRQPATAHVLGAEATP